MILKQLLCLGGFTDCWRDADVIQVLNVSPSFTVANYEPVSIAPVLQSNVFEHLVSVRQRRFKERRDVLPTTKLAYRESCAR